MGTPRIFSEWGGSKTFSFFWHLLLSWEYFYINWSGDGVGMVLSNSGALPYLTWVRHHHYEYSTAVWIGASALSQLSPEPHSTYSSNQQKLQGSCTSPRLISWELHLAVFTSNNTDYQKKSKNITPSSWMVNKFPLSLSLDVLIHLSNLIVLDGWMCAELMQYLRISSFSFSSLFPTFAYSALLSLAKHQATFRPFSFLCCILPFLLLQTEWELSKIGLWTTVFPNTV